mmetsp:Transcript_24344/g.67810  ORF Transcript_24344/g.67810 Transcript_24344/m.67810 type:complete len:327 (+) Transcript_24344:312-1292(+)
MLLFFFFSLLHVGFYRRKRLNLFLLFFCSLHVLPAQHILPILPGFLIAGPVHETQILVHDIGIIFCLVLPTHRTHPRRRKHDAVMQPPIDAIMKFKQPQRKLAIVAMPLASPVLARVVIVGEMLPAVLAVEEVHDEIAHDLRAFAGLELRVVGQRDGVVFGVADGVHVEEMPQTAREGGVVVSAGRAPGVVRDDLGADDVHQRVFRQRLGMLDDFGQDGMEVIGHGRRQHLLQMAHELVEGKLGVRRELVVGRREDGSLAQEAEGQQRILVDLLLRLGQVVRLVAVRRAVRMDAQHVGVILRLCGNLDVGHAKDLEGMQIEMLDLG